MIIHAYNASGSGLSQKSVLYFIHQIFPRFRHFDLGIVCFYSIIIIHCIVSFSFHFVPCRLIAHVANVYRLQPVWR